MHILRMEEFKEEMPDLLQIGILDELLNILKQMNALFQLQKSIEKICKSNTPKKPMCLVR